MLIFAFTLLGLIAGVAIDTLIVQLAVVAPDDEDGEEETHGESALHHTAQVSGEGGSLVLTLDISPQTWARRLLVMGLTAGVFAVAAARFDEPAHVGIVCAYASALIICAGTDALVYRVPNVITYPAIVAALIIGAVMTDADVWDVLAGGGLAGGVLLAPALLTGGVGMGMGDVKLATFVGLAVGFSHVVPAMLFMALSGGLVAGILLLTGLRKRGEPIPYAPFISAGALAALLWQGPAFVDLL